MNTTSILVALAYDDFISPNEAQRRMRNFIQCVKQFRRIKGLPVLKYIATTKADNGGHIHHNVVMNGGVDISDLAKLWGKGFIKVERLQIDGTNIIYIARYLTREQNIGRWCASKNLGGSNKRRSIESALEGFVPGGVVRVRM